MGKVERIPTEEIEELLERFTIGEAAIKLGVSKSGLQFQMRKRGIKGKIGHTPQSKARLSAAAFARYGYDDLPLLEMLKDLGEKLGRRPRMKDIPKGFPSKQVFQSRFGSWVKALKLAGFTFPPPVEKKKRLVRIPKVKRIKPARIPFEERVYKRLTYRLRYAILERDKFRCVYCGRSPKEHGIVLQIDHIIPRSLGGATTFKNLVSCCVECNQGKFNHYSTNPSEALRGAQ